MLRGFLKIPGFAWLQRGIDWIVQFFKGWNQGITSVLREGVERIRSISSSRASSKTSPFRFFHPRNLPPRLRVIFYYLTLVRRGNQKGIPRKPGQTPFEYGDTLKDQLPKVQEEVSYITDRFVEAKYSQHEIPADQAGVVRRLWLRIRQAMRK